MSYEQRYPWTGNAIKLLSLDVVSAFTEELQVDAFYSDELKLLARASIPELGQRETYDEWAAAIDRQARQFLDSISEGLGTEVLRDLIAWMDDAFLTQPAGDLDGAGSLMHYLVWEWDNEAEQGKLPLNTPKEARVRLLVRDYTAHNHSVSTEVERVVAGLSSDWDQKMDARHGVPDWSQTEVVSTCRYLNDLRFWTRIGNLLLRQQAVELVEWMEAPSREEQLGVALGDPPVALQIHLAS